MVHAGLRGGLHCTLPVRLGSFADSSGWASIGSKTLVNVEIVRTVEADEALSASQTALGGVSNVFIAQRRSVTLIAVGLTDVGLEEKRFKPLGADGGRGAGLAA